MVLLYVFVIPWERLVIVPGLGSGSKIIGTVAIGLGVLTVLSRGTMRQLNAVHIMLYFLTAYFALSILWAQSLLFAGVRSWTMIVNLAMAIVITETLSTRQDLLWSFRSYVLGSYVSVFGVSFRYLSGNVTTFQRRATLANTNENTVALILAIGMPIAWYLATNSSLSQSIGRLERALYFAFIPAGFIGVLFTASRGGLLSTLPFLLSIPFTLRSISRRQRGLVTAALVGGVALSAFLAPSSSWRRIGQTQDQISSGNLSSRGELWAEGVSLWLDSPMNMVLGIGSGNYQFIIGKVSHNTPLSVLVEGGVIGLGLFGLLGWAILRDLRSAQQVTSRIWTAIFAIWTISSLSLTLQWHKLSWTIVALAIVHVRLTPRGSNPTSLSRTPETKVVVRA